MTEPVTIGIDVGTTRMKAVAFRSDGTTRVSTSRVTQLERIGSDRYEHDTERVVQGVMEMLAEMRASAGGTVEAVGITGQGDGLWLVDALARPVRPAISWLDGRAADIVDGWMANGTAETIYRRTGSLVFPGSAGPLLAWLERHEPQSLAAASTAGYCKDVVFQRLTGVRATDPSDASVPFLDPRAWTYDAELLRITGLAHRSSLLAEVVAAPHGRLTSEAADSVGLPVGTPVVAAPYDLVAAAMGAGVSAVGDGLLIVGTTLAAEVIVDTLDTAGQPAGLTLSTRERGRWLRAMPAMAGTAALDWTLRMVGSTPQDLPQLLRASAPGSNGVLALPFLAGERAPFLEPRAAGLFDGLRLATTAPDLVRAMCEALAFSARHCFEAAGLRGSVVACGGGAASRAWLQIFADVLGRPISFPLEAEVGARGAAAAARATLGLAPLPLAPTEVVAPDSLAVGAYADGFERYLAAIEQARQNWPMRARATDASE